MSTRYERSIDENAANNTHASLVHLVGSGGRVLELGASTGYMTRLLMERGNDVTPVELDPTAFESLRSVTPQARLGDLEDPSILVGLGPFDVVLAGDVLEHLRDPQRTLAAAVALLGTGGRVVLSVPNVTHADLRLLLLDGRFEYHDTGLLDATHLRFFTLDSLLALIRSTGLLPWTVERITSGPGETELGIETSRLTHPVTAGILRSPESLTYQFVVEAVVDTGEPELRAESDRRLALSRAQESERISALGPAPDPFADLTERLHRTEIDRDVAQRALSGARAAEHAASARAARAEAWSAKLKDRAARAGTKSAKLTRELNLIRGSRTYRVLRWYVRQAERIAPRGTIRRRVFRNLVAGAAPGSGSTMRRTIAKPAVAVLDLTCTAPVPGVSVVVPMHGKWDYTWRCLRALASTEPGLPFEVVVVDDASPDDSLAQLQQNTRGITIVALDTNVGYVGACNAGIEASRGDLVVLLNNDTEVHPGWLAPLVETIADPTVGLVGSRLIYPDGSLQEAGGIVFSDGSGWNYGRFDDPEDSAFNYRRDVDYCSGASIMLRRTFLVENGGLDPTFAPGYYDDTDLAFTVRERGLRVVYEPRSVVMHHEGISHGVDESTGVKSFQPINLHKFQQKWADALASHPSREVAVVPWAARRRQGRGIVVVIDNEVPRPDEDSGSLRMQSVLETLRELGLHVIFVPANKNRHEPYVGNLQQLGIEVVYGRGTIDHALRPLARDVVAIMLSRASVARSHMVPVRNALPDAPLIFDTVDLHFLRGERADEVAGRSAPSAATNAIREFELAAVRAADVTLVVSTFEQRLLAKVEPMADVRLLSNRHVPRGGQPAAEGRTGLLFVGSFAHPPNNDAVGWFIREILPLIVQDHPNLVVTVVGRNPDAGLVSAAPAQVRFLGHVPDLAPLYASARATIAPLRYGAGVKGKIGESLAHGVPAVMTPIGAEGMGIRDGENGLVANSAQDFAARVTLVLDDDELWTRLSTAGRAHVDATFGTIPFKAQLIEALRAGASHVGQPNRARIDDLLADLS